MSNNHFDVTMFVFVNNDFDVTMFVFVLKQAEKSCYLLTELSIIAKQEHEALIELQRRMAVVALLKVSN